MEEELEAERQARAKANKQRSDLAKEIDSLEERLDEASGVTTAQVDGQKEGCGGQHARSKWTPPTCLLVTLQPPRKIAAENSDLLRLVGELDINPESSGQAEVCSCCPAQEMGETKPPLLVFDSGSKCTHRRPRQWWRSQQNPTRAVTK